MSRMPRAGGRYIHPLQINGDELTEEVGRGVFTLVANTRYFFILGGADAPFLGVTLTGYDAAMVLTSAAIQDTDHPDQEVPNHSVIVGEWVTEDPTTAFIAADGAGWVGTNGVLAVAGGAVGGAKWHVAETAAFRTRLDIQVGATGGRVRVSSHGKD
jgi:hypothetical protein